MEKYKNRNCVELSIERKDGILVLKNDRGLTWQVPTNFSDQVAMSMLVYGALLDKDWFCSTWCSRFKITMIVEEGD